MIKILYLGNYLKNSRSNPTYIFTLSKLLKEEGFVVNCASSKVNKVSRLLNMITMLVKNRKADFIIIDTYGTLNFYYAFVLSVICRFLKRSYIPILHGGTLPKRLVTNPTLSKILFKHSLTNVAPSLFMKNAFNKYGYNNVEHIPNALNVSDYEFLESRNFSKLRLLWVRSLAQIYNPELALLTASELISQGFDLELCMVGPDVEDMIDGLKQKALEKNVDIRFTGKLSKKVWQKISQDYNVLINTTNYDNMPLSLMEAMALGMPIVSTNVGGIPYLITNEENGLLVEPNDFSMMAEAVARLYNDKNLRGKLITNGRKTVEMYDWKVIRHQWIKILN